MWFSDSKDWQILTEAQGVFRAFFSGLFWLQKFDLSATSNPPGTVDGWDLEWKKKSAKKKVFRTRSHLPRALKETTDLPFKMHPNSFDQWHAAAGKWYT